MLTENRVMGENSPALIMNGFAVFTRTGKREMSKLKKNLSSPCPTSTKLLQLSECIFLSFQMRTDHLGKEEI